MLSVVLDTNVVVSALIKDKGLEAAILDLAVNKELRLCVSASILTEYEGVLRRPKLRFDPTRVGLILAQIRAAAALVSPVRPVSVSSDEADNRFLECAEAAGADFLVTGNTRHFPKRWKGTRVVNARQLIVRVASQGGLARGPLSRRVPASPPGRSGRTP